MLAIVIAAIAMRPLIVSARGVNPTRPYRRTRTGPYSAPTSSFERRETRSLTTRRETGRPSSISCGERAGEEGGPVRGKEGGGGRGKGGKEVCDYAESDRAAFVDLLPGG